MTPTKHNIYIFKGHLPVDMDHVRVETPIYEGVYVEIWQTTASLLFQGYLQDQLENPRT